MQQNFFLHIVPPRVLFVGCQHFCLEMMMAKRPSSDGASWSASELKTLKNSPTRTAPRRERPRPWPRRPRLSEQKAIAHWYFVYRKSQKAPAKKK